MKDEDFTKYKWISLCSGIVFVIGFIWADTLGSLSALPSNFIISAFAMNNLILAIVFPFIYIFQLKGRRTIPINVLLFILSIVYIGCIVREANSY